VAATVFYMEGRNSIPGIIRVLIVDDSAYVRKVVREMLSQNPFIDVVGAARNGVEGLELAASLDPDVITSDLTMPEMDGVNFVREQMRLRPTPIVVMSSLSEDGPEVMGALEAGAVDFVQKPTALATEAILAVRSQLVDAIKTAATARPERIKLARAENLPTLPTAVSGAGSFDAIVIGISTGGPQALRFMLPQLAATFPVPIAMVMHMPVGYTAMYAEKLNEISGITVVEARGGEAMQSGAALLAPAGKHMYFKRRADGTVVTRLSLTPHGTPHRPSVDVMFESAAATFGARTLGVVMTGMGTDGRAGSAAVKAQGGTIFAESEESCIVFGMPGAIVEAGLADRIVRLDDMARVLTEVV
jgi:two-component system chemotaxis response regulator CheB